MGGQTKYCGGKVVAITHEIICISQLLRAHARAASRVYAYAFNNSWSYFKYPSNYANELIGCYINVRLHILTLSSSVPDARNLMAMGTNK